MSTLDRCYFGNLFALFFISSSRLSGNHSECVSLTTNTAYRIVLGWMYFLVWLFWYCFKALPDLYVASA